MGVFSNAKDRLIEPVALSYLNGTLLPRYGRAIGLIIDSTARTLQIEVELKGETAPVKIEITDYEITKEDDCYFLVLKGICTSREWLTELARDHLCNRRFDLGAKAGSLLIRLL